MPGQAQGHGRQGAGGDGRPVAGAPALRPRPAGQAQPGQPQQELQAAGDAGEKHRRDHGPGAKPGPDHGHELDVAGAEHLEHVGNQENEKAAGQPQGAVAKAGQAREGPVHGQKQGHGRKGDPVGDAPGAQVRHGRRQAGQGGQGEGQDGFRIRCHGVSRVWPVLNGSPAPCPTPVLTAAWKIVHFQEERLNARGPLRPRA